MFKKSESYVPHTNWVEGEEITVEQAVLTGTQRDDATVEALAAANKALIRPGSGTVALELRFRSDGTFEANDDSVLQLYAAAGKDHYTRIATLTIIQGEQLHSTGIYFCDSIVATLENWISATEVVQPETLDNHIARYVLNTHGYNRFLLIASDLDTTTIYVDWRPL